MTKVRAYMLRTENDVLEFWDSQKIFEKSVDQNKSNEPFIFFDGPPFATGTPHWGHIFISQVKDTVLRYQTQKGLYVPRRWGWDCHGVPLESQIEKRFKIKDKREIETSIGIAEFNAACRAVIMENDHLWRKSIRRIGRWVDMDSQYRTMDNDFAESVWWGLGQLWEKNLIYKGFRISLYSPSLGIPLSHTDVAMEVKYKNETIETPVVRFQVKDESWAKIRSRVKSAIEDQVQEHNQMLRDAEKELNFVQKQSTRKFAFNFSKRVSASVLPGESKSSVELEEAKEKSEVITTNIKTLSTISKTLELQHPLNILAWTTTPWTLPANTCVAVGPEIAYSIFYLPGSSEFVLVADSRAVPVISLHFKENIVNTPELEEKLSKMDSGEFFNTLDLDIVKIATLEGKDLEGLEYIPMFNPTQKIKEYEQKSGVFKIYAKDFVTDEDGTGIVHIAPYGEDDFELIKERNLPYFLVLNEYGEVLPTLNEKLSPVYNKLYSEANPLITRIIEKEGALFGSFNHSHKVPYFDRDGKNVYYAPQEGWFIAETKFKERSLELNEQINWYPADLKHGRFGKGLETAPDWSISRLRYWGNPLPIWKNKDGTKHIFVSSIEDLVSKSINPWYRLLNSKDLDPHFYSTHKTVIFSDSQSKLPLGN